jgi:hypothetical protein
VLCIISCHLCVIQNGKNVLFRFNKNFYGCVNNKNIVKRKSNELIKFRITKTKHYPMNKNRIKRIKKVNILTVNWGVCSLSYRL